MKTEKEYLEFINDKLFHKFIFEWMITLSRRQPSRGCNDVSFSLEKLYTKTELKKMIKNFEIHNNSGIEVCDNYISLRLKMYESDFVCISFLALSILDNIRSDKYFLNLEERSNFFINCLVASPQNGNWDEDSIMFKKKYYPELNEKENVNKIKQKLNIYHKLAYKSHLQSYSHGEIYSIIVFYIVNMPSFKKTYSKINFIDTCLN